jgi:ABC-type Zn uptake system ZnuABC Zn-binding protein ZnuA
MVRISVALAGARRNRTLKTTIAGAAALLAAALVLPACSGPTFDGAAAGTTRMQLVTTVAPLTSIVAAVAGDRADITGIVPEGTNSHTFEPPPSAAEVLARADVVFVNGLQLEEPTRKLAETVGKDGAQLVELGPAAIDESRWVYDFSFPRDGGKPNPHLWTDPPLARRYGELVRDTLVRRDPAGAGTYGANFDAWSRQVDELDRGMRTAFATLPANRRKLVTYHDAYAYFAQAYGWEVVGAIQVEHFEDPTAREVGELVDQVRSEDVKAIFGSEVFPSPVLEQIGRETGVRYVDVLRDDDLPGAPGEPEHSWLGLMRFDYVTIVESLGGTAPALKAIDIREDTVSHADYPQ